MGIMNRDIARLHQRVVIKFATGRKLWDAEEIRGLIACIARIDDVEVRANQKLAAVEDSGFVELPGADFRHPPWDDGVTAGIQRRIDEVGPPDDFSEVGRTG